MEYCRNLNFEKNPSYEYLRGLLKKILMKNETFNDFIFFLNKNNIENKN